MKKLLILLFAVVYTPTYALTITSLNIEWFGKGGTLRGTIDDEYRVKRLRQLLLEEMTPSDVFVFQEITEPELLQKSFPEYDCKTYPLRSQHQHVVLCANTPGTIEFFQVKEVALNSFGLRPAAGITIKLAPKKKLNIIGLHLKSGLRDSALRLDQLRELVKKTEYLDNAVIIGDFNAYPKEATTLEKDDELLFDEILAPLGFSQAYYEGGTFLNRSQRRFDHAWVKGVNLVATSVFGPCRKDSLQNWRFMDFGFYNRFISDHCALQVEI